MKKLTLKAGWLIDENRNKWSLEFFGSEEGAIEAAESCDWGDKSTDNINCSRLSDCSRLRGCSRLSERDVFFASFGDYTLTIDPDKCRGGCTTMTHREWLEYDGNNLSEEDKTYLETVTKPAIKLYLATRG